MKFYRYSIPFREPFQISRRSFQRREGLILALRRDDRSCLGEAAPLPGFSAETLEETAGQLRKMAPALSKFFRDRLPEYAAFQQLCEEHAPVPSLRFALDTLFYDACSHLEGRPLRKSLNPDAVELLEMNATLGLAEPEKMLEQVRQYHLEGFTTFKVKVGKDFKAERTLLTALRKQYADARIRIDANQAWTEQEAVQNLSALEDLDIEYCEQPVKAGDLEGLAKITEASSMAIAADEAVRNPATARRIIREKAADLLILKPMMIGSFSENMEICRLAQKQNMKVVMTTLFDAAPGRLATAQLAAAAASPDLAQGLATGRLLKGDVWDDRLFISGNRFNLPGAAGLGSPDDFDPEQAGLDTLEGR